ncbi:MAG: hypothetical protein MUP90_13415 [Gammaproteobacteria bacterium]|nr:hypothetical protein [Gammaproteobacteria bacterium]
MGTRRDDITSEQRKQIVLEVLSPQRAWGTVSKLATQYGVSRETIYTLAAQGERVLLGGLEPQRHGPPASEKIVAVNRNRVVRGVVALTEVGVSQRDVAFCLAELLDTRVSVGWVNAELAHIERAAEVVNAQWQPPVDETLAGDELYANGLPNLLVVGNDSLYIYALTRQASCDGETWACVLWDVPGAAHFASDGGVGLAKGARLAEVGSHQLDWDHLLRPLWGQVTRLEKQAYAALEAVAERAAKFDQASTPKRLAHHLAAWERLQSTATALITRYDACAQIARQVDAQFALIDLASGQLRDPIAGAACLRDLGWQLQSWSGRIYAKLSSNLRNWADDLFRYHSVLQQALAPLGVQWGTHAIQSLCRLWQLEATAKRHPLAWGEQQQSHGLWAQALDAAVAVLGPEPLGPAGEALSVVLNRAWRGSMLAECLNSRLRPILAQRKHTDQGCLELFRFLHNVRPFQRGKRAHHSPAQLVGLDVPDDPFVLLGLAPKVSS